MRGKILHLEVSENKILGTVLHIDRFGNGTTNISRGLLSRRIDSSKLRVSAGPATIVGISDYYEEGTTGRPVALWGSSGYLEVAVTGGSAQKTIGFSRHQQVLIEW